MDLYKKRNLSVLLNELVKINGLEWIRLHYTYPNGFPMEVLEIMRNNDKICNYLDIPIQHINDDILTGMHRRISEKEIRKLIDDIRNIIPSIALRTTLLVGFPGESKKIYRQLASFVQEVQFDRLGVFSYSHEENTPAYALKDTVLRREKENRKEEIMAIQQEISLQKNQQKIGKTFKVIIDSATGSHYVGRSEFDSPEVDNTVLIPKKSSSCIIGNFYPVRIVKADNYDLYGELETHTP